MEQAIRLCDHCRAPILPRAPYVEATITHNREPTGQEMVSMGMVVAPLAPPEDADESFDGAEAVADRYKNLYGPTGGVPMVKADERVMHFCDYDHLRAHLTG